MRIHLHSSKTDYDRWITVEDELTIMVGRDGGALISLPDAYCNERLLSPLETERAIEDLEA